MKIDIEQVEATLSQETELEREAVLKVIRILKQAKEEEDASKPAPIKPPKFEPLLLFIPGPCPEESVAFLVEFDGEIPHPAVLDKLYGAIREANNKAKKKNIFGTLAEVVESMPRKWLKGTGLKLRYKGPVIIQQVENEVPGVEQARNEEDDLNEAEQVLAQTGREMANLQQALEESGASITVTRRGSGGNRETTGSGA